MTNFMKIRPAEAELFQEDKQASGQTDGRTDGRTDRQTDMTKLTGTGQYMSRFIFVGITGSDSKKCDVLVKNGKSGYTAL
jgi:hypothetical protein